MVQQAPPAVGTVLDGYRFKGGDPAQESSWEQVAPIDVSAQYGAGARQLPNGVIERVGPRGGVQRIGSANGGEQSGASALVGADARARFMINLGPLQESQRILEGMDAEGYTLDQDWGAAALEAIPFDGGFAARKAGGSDYNAYTQAAKTFEAAIMPIMSGAAVTPTEAQRMVRAAIPQPGDSPEVLRQKALQRRQMINAVAQGIGQPAPYDMNEAQALPEASPTVNAVANSVFDSPEIVERDGKVFYAVGLEPGQGAPANLQTRYGADGEISADDMLAAGYVPDQETGKWLYPADNGPLPPEGPAGPQGGGGGGIADLILGRDGRERATDARSEMGKGFGRQLDAGVRGAADTLTFGLADEISAGLDTIIPLNPGRRSIWDSSIGDAFRHNVAIERGIDDADAQDVGGARLAGQVAGGFAGVGGLARTGTGIAARAGMAGRGLLPATARGTAAGVGYGAAYGYGSGEGNALQRADDAAVGAGVGALGGAIAPAAGRYVVRPAANALAAPLRALGRGAGAVGERMGVPGASALRAASTINPLAAGVERFARVSPQNEGQMAARGNALSAETIQPTFVDLVNDGGRGTLRAAATRQTPGRDAAREFAEGRVEALPSRLSMQARRIVSSDNRPVEEIVGELTEARGNQARTTYAEPYAERVQIDPLTAQQLSGAPGRAAIQRARAAAEAFNDTAAMQELDALAAGQTQEVSAATLDRIRQALSGRAERLAQNPATRAVGAGVGQRAGIVDQALDNVEGLAPARQAYRDASRQIEATEMGGRFMNANPDDFQGAMQGLTPEQLQPARAATARSIEIAARNPGSAPGVARRLYADPETANMGQAVMGEDMARLSQAARMEAQATRNAIEVNPRAGSPTNLNQQDTLNAAGEALGAVRDVASGNLIGLAGRAISTLRGRGFNDREAEALLQAAVDPARTDELVGMLAQRMSRREARNLARAIRYQITAGSQSAQRN